MSCPNCGLETLPEQKFCRSCGTSLQVVTQPLAERAAISQSEKIALKDERYRPNTLVLWGFIVMFLGTALGVIGKMLIHVDAVTVVGVLISLAGIFLTAYPYLAPSPRKKSDPTPEVERLTQSEPKSLHESTVDYLPSVTERTTDLLKEPATRPKEKDSASFQA